MKKKIPTNAKIVMFEICGFIISILPLLIVLMANRERYFCDISSGIRLGFGAIIVIVFIFLKAMDKIKMPGATVGFLIVFILSYLLEAVLKDLTLLSGCALLGQVLDLIIFQPIIKQLKEKNEEEKAEKVSQSIANKIEEVISKYTTTGRT